MKRSLCLCLALSMLFGCILCFSSCKASKPLTEEEPALKELADAWRAVFVDRSVNVTGISWMPGLISSRMYITDDPTNIAETVQFFAGLDPDKFVLKGDNHNTEAYVMGLQLFFHGTSTADSSPNGKSHSPFPLYITVTDDDLVYINTQDNTVTACYTDSGITRKGLEDFLRQRNFKW